MVNQSNKMTDVLRECIAELYCRKVSLSQPNNPQMLIKVQKFRSHMDNDMMPVKDLSDLELLRFAAMVLDQIDNPE